MASDHRGQLPLGEPPSEFPSEVADSEDPTPGVRSRSAASVPEDLAGGSGTWRDRAATVMALPLIWAIRAYQIVISPTIPPSCRFYPSCSAYAVTALRRFGPFRGGWLALRRLGRCHPWNPGGVDHVPPRHAPPPAGHRECAAPGEEPRAA